VPEKRADTLLKTMRVIEYSYSDKPGPPAFGNEPGPPTYGAAIIAATLNEVSHHGTQICMLRDLYRVTNGRMLSTER
jgi:hypothetical protein